MIVLGFPMDEDIPWGQGKVHVWGCDDSTSLLYFYLFSRPIYEVLVRFYYVFAQQ